ncbi:general transcription factor II-I isoform X2 [Amia ocellicauda]
MVPVAQQLVLLSCAALLLLRTLFNSASLCCGVPISFSSHPSSMAQAADLAAGAPEDEALDSHAAVTFLMSALESMCKELAKSRAEVACVAVCNNEVFVVGTERGRAFASSRLDFQRDFISYCISEEENVRVQKHQRRGVKPGREEGSDRETLRKAVEDLFCICYGKALGKSSLVPVPYEQIQSDPSAVAVKGLPDGLCFKEPACYDTLTLRHILGRKSQIAFVVKRPFKEQKKKMGEQVSKAAENGSPDSFVAVQVKAEPSEDRDDLEMTTVTVKEELVDPEYTLYPLIGNCLGEEFGEDEERESVVTGSTPQAASEASDDPEVEVTIEASANCWLPAGIDLALGRPRADAPQPFNSKNTQCSTKWGMTVLRKWYQGHFKRSASSIDAMSASELDKVLQQFYINAKTSKKDKYTKNSLNAIRKSINRYLRGPPLRRDINILCDSEFPASNRTYREVCRTLKMEGKASTKHTAPMAVEDLLKLYQSHVLKPSSPQTLLNKVWFDIMFFFGRHGGGGRYTQREFTRESFGFGIDEYGREFVYAVKDERADAEHQTHHRVRMYALPGDPHCPVAAFQLYLSKLNPFSNALFQHPILHPSTDIWYNTKPVGVNVLGSMMPRLSKEAQLSAIYSNHSIRMTPVVLLQGLLQTHRSEGQ